MKNLTIAFDESGNTGQNLLDKDQPYFCLASVNFNENELDELTKLFTSKSNELHFKRLKKYVKTQNQILNLCNHNLISFSTIKFYLIDKKIALYGHIIDRLIEPVYYDMGRDIHQDNSSLILTNLLYTFSEQVWNKELKNNFLVNFQNLIISNTIEAADLFYHSLDKLMNSVCSKNQLTILNIIKASQIQKEQIVAGIEKYSIDLSLPTFNVLCDSWFKEHKSKFAIIHDNSKQIDFWEEMIQYLADPEMMEEKEVGYGENKMTFPLKFSKLELVDSLDYKSIQIADLIASSITYALKEQNNLKENKFARKIWDSKLFQIEHKSMRALDDKALMRLIEQGNQNGENILDYLTDMKIKNKK